MQLDTLLRTDTNAKTPAEDAMPKSLEINAIIATGFHIPGKYASWETQTSNYHQAIPTNV